MDELDAILKTCDAILPACGGLSSPSKAVLATVVHVKGSAYRRPGARMMILPDGRRIGSISGGCLEGDVSKKAWWYTEEGRPSVRVYDTSSDEDAVWEFGLGCNGVIHVLLERIDTPSTRRALGFLRSCRASRKPGVMSTVIRASETSFLHVGERIFAGTPGAARLDTHIQATLRERKSRLVYLGDCDVFVEWIGPPPALVIFGAGHDAIPVVNIAKQLGWRVTVADGRPAYATAERFPSADNVVVMRSPHLTAGIEITEDTAVVMMTHNYPQDGRLLREILPHNPRYLGMLGPRKRAETLFAEIGARIDIADVHAPVGLDIGAGNPEAIALSIVSEIQAVLAGRTGMKLRHRRGPIHAPVPEAGESREIRVLETEYVACELQSASG